MTVTVNSSIVIGVRKDLISNSSRVRIEAEEPIAQYFKKVGLPVDEAERFFLMEDDRIENPYYQMEREFIYVDSGDPDLEESDPGDDEVLQFFIKNITKEETFDCFITSEEKKLFSHLTGESDFSEDQPISLEGDKLILLRCSLYY